MKAAVHFATVINRNCSLVAPPLTRSVVGEFPNVASHNVLGDQLYHPKAVKHEKQFCSGQFLGARRDRILEKIFRD